MSCKMSSAVCCLVCTLVIAMTGYAAAQQYFSGWADIFPFEPCYRDAEQSRYRLELVTYTERKTTSTFCMMLTVTPANECASGANRCCNTDFKKLKFFPNPSCARSVDSFTVGSNPLSKAITWEYNFNKTIVKLTPLGLVLSRANNTMICVNLKAPCQTLNQFSPDGFSLQYAMYDTRRGNYECCPLGLATWADMPDDEYRTASTASAPSP